MAASLHWLPTPPTPLPTVTALDAVPSLTGPLVEVSAVHTADGGRVQLRRGGLDAFRVGADGAIDLLRLIATATALVGDGHDAHVATAVARLLDTLDPAEEVMPPPAS